MTSPTSRQFDGSTVRPPRRQRRIRGAPRIASRFTSPAAGRVARGLGYASWLVLLLGTGSTFVLPGGPEDVPIRSAVVITLVVFFVTLVARLLLEAARHPARRMSLTFLATGVVLWAIGSAMVGASQTAGAVSFPAHGEVFYLASYLGMAGFLVLDVPRRAIATGAIWLEAAVVCGAVACLAAFVVLTPISQRFDRGGLPLLLAILYPLIDLFLGIIVVAQLMLRRRAPSLRTAALTLGFLGLAVADANLVLSLGPNTYSSNLVLDAVWGASFAAIVGAACAPASSDLPRPIEQRAAPLLPIAGALAVVVLVLHPGGIAGWFVMVPALVTLGCVGARMMLALREAQGAAEAKRLSLTDELTGLPNRRAMMASADETLRGDAPLGLVLLDLDEFKDINDSLGHMVGDEVLVLLAHRLRTTIDPDIMLARFGGDEFALLAPISDEVRLFEIAEHVRSALKSPLWVDNMALSIDASVGITVRRPGDVSSTEILRRADIAMYEAKQSRSGVLLFDASLDGFSRQRLRRDGELREAIADDQLVVWYQPQVDARTRRVVALEALIRWQHPTLGLLSPITFLPDARRSGLMPTLTAVLIREVVLDARRWLDEGFTFRVALNFAPPELIGGDLTPELFRALDQAGLPGDAVLVEVTEDSFMADPERAREALFELSEHHVETSIDDYGTGFSSLAYLRDLPMQELKMDQSFVSTMLRDERSLLIVQTTTQMAHALGLRLVAEGVEDAETAATLLTMGVDVFQGYHIAKPMPAREIAPWVRRWSGPGGGEGGLRPLSDVR